MGVPRLWVVSAIAVNSGVWACIAGASPSIALPNPTGAQPIGTIVVRLADSSRTAGPPGAKFPRPVTLQIWYPARGRASTTAPYLIEPALLDAMVAGGFYGVETTTLRSWARVRTHAGLVVGPAPGRHPLLTLSHGLGLPRASYTSIAEELASHGTIVAVIDHAYGGMTTTASGRVLAAGDDSTNWDDIAAHLRQMEQWATDISFVLDRLQSPEALPADVRAVARGIEWARVAAAGHSSGGLAAIQVATRDPRVRASIDMDGGLRSPEGQPLAGFVTTGVTRPTLLLQSHPVYSDADLARRHRSRAQYEIAGRAAHTALDSLAARSRAPLIDASLSGAGHMSFSDAPFTMPVTITQFGGRIIDAHRGWEVTTSAVRAFLDAAFRDDEVAAKFARAAERYPELAARAAGAQR